MHTPTSLSCTARALRRPCSADLEEITHPSPHKPIDQQVGDMKPYSLKDTKVRRCNPHPLALGTVQNKTGHSSLSK